MVVVWILVGVIIGVITTLLCVRRHLVGDLIIAHPDSGEAPNTLAQFYDPIEKFQHKEHIMMKIVHVNYKSQE